MSTPSPVTQIEEWLLAEDHQRAAEACLDLLAEQPGDPDLLTLLALSEEISGQVEQAIERLQSVSANHPDHVRSVFHLGRLLAQVGRADLAREAFNASIALSPNHAPSRTLLARLDFQRGDQSAAIEGLRVALRADPDYVPALCDLAILLVETGAVEEAHGLASQAVKLASDESSAQMAMGIVFEAQGHIGFAEQCLVNATDQDPSFFQGMMALSRVYQAKGEHDKVVSLLDRLSDDQKSHPAARYARAFSLVRLGQLTPARVLYEGLVQEKPDLKTALQLMDLYIQQNDHPALVDFGQQIDRNDPSGELAGRFVDARLAEFAGQLGEAIEKLKSLVGSEPFEFDVRVRLLLARLFLRQGETQAVLETLQGLAERNPLHYRVRWEMAQLAEQAGDQAFALRMIDAVLADSSLQAEVLGRSATMRLHILDRLERYDEALKDIQAGNRAMGWLPPPMPLMDTELPDLSAIRRQPEGSEVDSPSLIWVPGWPWAGRELVLAALAQISGATVLPMAEGASRHQHLGLVPGEVPAVGLSEDQAHSMRRRYLRTVNDQASCVIEPFPCRAADLVRLWEVFPASTAVRVTCEPNYLRLQWHLAGYRQVDSMLEVWLEEQKALDRVTEETPLKMLSIALEDLLEPATTASAIETLMTALSVPASEKMTQHVLTLAQRHGYRAPKHWTHYF